MAALAELRQFPLNLPDDQNEARAVCEIAKANDRRGSIRAKGA
jgi:hypothetical protein